MRVLIFGDSITQGYWDLNGGWVRLLHEYYGRRQLMDLSHLDQPFIFNLGVSGDITQGVIKRLAAETQARKWRWPEEEIAYIFAIGLNDTIVVDGAQRSTPEKFAQELQSLTDEAKSMSKRIMFIGLTPCEEEKANIRPDNQKEFTNSRIQTFDNTLQKVCQENSITYIGLFETMNEKLADNQELFVDGLHPNSQGHQLIFELVQPALDKLINT
jgi:acyl-CoA thioesterase-1